MADEEGGNDSGSEDTGRDDGGDEEETSGRGEEVGGGTGEAKEVGDRSDDQDAPISGRLPGPVDPPGSSTQG